MRGKLSEWNCLCAEGERGGALTEGEKEDGEEEKQAANMTNRLTCAR